MRIFEYDESPCFVDGEIVKHLPRIQRAYIKNTDNFVYYRKDSDADDCGVDIVLSNWDTTITFSTIQELKRFMRDEIKIFYDDYKRGYFSDDDWHMFMDGDFEF